MARAHCDQCRQLSGQSDNLWDEELPTDVQNKCRKLLYRVSTLLEDGARSELSPLYDLENIIVTMMPPMKLTAW